VLKFLKNEYKVGSAPRVPFFKEKVWTKRRKAFKTNIKCYTFGIKAWKIGSINKWALSFRPFYK